jgi:hypothetical protein
LTSGSDIWAVILNVLDNKPLYSLNAGNGNKALVLNGATLIDGNGGPPKADSVIVVGDSKKIIARLLHLQSAIGLYSRLQ